MLKICETRCNECLFSEQRIVSKKRMAGIVKECRAEDKYFICHKNSMNGDDVMCRGWHETQPPSQMERIAGRLRMIEFVPHKDKP